VDSARVRSKYVKLTLLLVCALIFRRRSAR
jgi:hypothetical protein